MPKSGGTKQIKLRKTILARDSQGLKERPLFVNHFQVSRSEGDWYIDAGLIPIDQILSLPTKDEAEFLVLERLAMTLSSIKKLRDQISEVIEKAEQQATSDGD